jgi:hypothetical protein
MVSGWHYMLDASLLVFKILYPSDSSPSDRKTIYIYYTIRVLSVVHYWNYALLYYPKFDEAKRKEEFFPCAECYRCQPGKDGTEEEPEREQKNRHRYGCVICEGCKGCLKCNETHDSDCVSKCKSYKTGKELKESKAPKEGSKPEDNRKLDEGSTNEDGNTPDEGSIPEDSRVRGVISYDVL